MNLLKLSLVDLAPAYELIDEFNSSLKNKWIPGFNRDYARKQAAFLKATESYEGRSRFMRLIFKSPKPPGRPPPGLFNEMSGQLWRDWIAAISYPVENLHVLPKTKRDLLQTLNNNLNEQYFVLNGLQTCYEESNVTVVVGPAGVCVVRLMNNKPALDSSSLPEIEYIPLPVPWQLNEEEPHEEHTTQLAIFKIIDELLSFHQNTLHDGPISALKVAEKLISQRKDELLKLAAAL